MAEREVQAAAWLTEEFIADEQAFRIGCEYMLRQVAPDATVATGSIIVRDATEARSHEMPRPNCRFIVVRAMVSDDA